MNLTVKVKKTDKGWAEIQARWAQISNAKPYTKVGVIGQAAATPHEEGGKSPLTNVQLALIHEFGTADGHIPERSFLRETFGLHRQEYQDLLKKLMGGVLRGKIPLDKAFGILGLTIQTSIKRRITDQEPPFEPNAPRTVAAKGSSVPLVDTGRLLGSITWEVSLDGAK